ncbi:MAG: hypothetical protein WCL54_08425 [Clostridia bacterium]
MKRFKLIKIWKWIKHHRASIVLSFGLVFISYLIFKVQLDVFRRPNDTFFYLTQDLAFLPLDVLFVTLILERVLAWREKLDKRRIIHIVISALFSEMGNDTVRILSQFNTDLDEIKQKINITPEWSLRDYDDLARFAKTRHYVTNSQASDLMAMKEYMMAKKPFLLSIFENNNLLEHATFTDTLWAVYHLLEELQSRSDFSNLPPEDYAHLSVDIKRAFQLLLIEWVYYMKRLKKQYPFLYSLAIRKNPFFEEHVIIGKDY